MSSPSPSLTPPAHSNEEQHGLQHERLMAEVFALRKALAEQSKPWWQIVLESAGGAALITVIFGGMLGGLVTGMYQSAQAKIQRENAARKRLQELRFQAETEALQLVSTTVAAAEDLLQLSSKSFLQASKEQQDGIRKAFTLADATWRKQNTIVIRFKFHYYYRDNPEVMMAWKQTRERVSGYVNCAGQWAEQHPGYIEGLGVGCTTEKAAILDSLDVLQKSLPKLD